MAQEFRLDNQHRLDNEESGSNEQASTPQKDSSSNELAPILQKRRLLTEGERSEVRSVLTEIVTDETAALRKELERHRSELGQHKRDLEIAQRRASEGERRVNKGKAHIHKLENLWLDAPPEIQQRLQEVIFDSQMTPRDMESPRRSIGGNLQPTPEDREVTNGLPDFAPRPRSQNGTPACLSSKSVNAMSFSSSTNHPETASKPPGMPSVPLQLIKGSALKSAQQKRLSNVSAATAEHNIGSSSEDGSSDSEVSDDDKRKQDPIGTITVSPEHYEQMLHSARDADKAKADYEMRMQMLTKQDKGISSASAEGTAQAPSAALQRLEEALAREADARADLERALAGLREEQAWHDLPPPQGMLAAPLLLSGPGGVKSVGASPERAHPATRNTIDLTSPQTVWWMGGTPGKSTAVSA